MNFAQAARDRKVLAIVQAIDHDLGERVTGPQAASVADQLEVAPRLYWVQLARVASELAGETVNPPTYRNGRSETVEQIVSVFRQRAARCGLGCTRDTVPTASPAPVVQPLYQRGGKP